MKNEKGAMTLVMVAATGLVAALAVATAAVAVAYAARTTANTSADAAALAAAVATYPPAKDGSDPLAEARRAASYNGAQLVSCACSVNRSLRARTVTVVTSVGVVVPLFGELDVKGAARAEFDPRRWLGR